MSSRAHSRLLNGILYSLLLMLLLTCPMKRVMKQALAIPVLPLTLAEKNNHSFCVKLVTETTVTAKQKAERAQKQLFVPSFPRSVTSFAVTIAIWKKAYADNAALGPSKRFIRYRKLLI